MIVCVVSVMASTRLSTRRVTKKPPASPSTTTIASDQRPAAMTMSLQALALLEVAPDQQPEAAGKLDDHAPARGARCAVRVLEPAIDGLGPARLVEHAGGERADIAGEPLAGRRW